MTDQKNDTTTTPTTQVDEVKRMRKFANYMKANVSCATVTFASRKMEAFKGKYFMEQLKKYDNGKYKSLGDDAMDLANALLREKYIIKVMKNPDKRADSKNKIIPVRTPDKNTFDPKGRYIWLYVVFEHDPKKVNCITHIILYHKKKSLEMQRSNENSIVTKTYLALPARTQVRGKHDVEKYLRHDSRRRFLFHVSVSYLASSHESRCVVSLCHVSSDHDWIHHRTSLCVRCVLDRGIRFLDSTQFL